jgi:AcrR family transcriptional regulator
MPIETEATVTGWKERARDRALAGAVQRADDQVTRLVQAAREMVAEGLDVTIPALVARARMSTATFYRHFASRDEFLLAVLEEQLLLGAQQLRDAVARCLDPVERLRAFVDTYIGFPANYGSTKMRRTRIQEGQRLRSINPPRTRDASEPMAAVLIDIIDELTAAGLSHVNDAPTTARSITHMLTGHLVDAAYADDSGEAYVRLREYGFEVSCTLLGLGDVGSGPQPERV